MLDWQLLRSRANDDEEFRMHARFWNSTIRLGIGHEKHKVSIEAGEVVAIQPWGRSVAGDLSIQAPTADWDALLEAVPKPFYQDLYAASLHHGFDVLGDIKNFCAYYPAIRRLIEVMREVRNG